jgi:predicted nucleic acid-binding protein
VSSLFDSDILIDLIGSDPALLQRVGHLLDAGIAISVISYMATLQGIIKHHSGNNRNVVAEQFAALLGDITVFDVTLPIGQRCAEIRYLLRADKRVVRKRGLDLVIAATAIEYDLTLVTRNLQDFHDVPGLRMLNP